MGLFEVVPVLEHPEFQAVRVDVSPRRRFPDVLPERPVVPLNLPVVLGRVRGVADVPDPELPEERGEPRSELPAAVGAYPGNPERGFPDEVRDELGGRPDGVLGMEPGENEPGTVVHRVVLGFAPDAPEREGNVHLDLASGFVEGVQGFPPPAPFAGIPVPDAVSAQDAENGGLVQNRPGKFRVPEGDGARSFLREVPGQRADFPFDRFRRSVLRGTGLRSGFLRNEAGFPFDPVFRREFPEHPFGNPEDGSRVFSGAFAADVLGHDADFRFDHVGAAVTDGHRRIGSAEYLRPHPIRLSFLP